MDPDRDKALVLSIRREGQAFIDEPIRATPKPASALRRAIATMFGSKLPEPVIVGYERVRLNWIKPPR